MSVASLERAIVAGAREVLNNKELRVKDLMEWSTGEVKPQEGEVVIFVPALNVYVAVKAEHDKRVK